MRTKILALALGLALVASLASAELGYRKVVSSSAGADTITIKASTLTVVNDGASVIYVRVFWEGETPVAATSASAEIKSGEGFTFSRAVNIDAISIISASSSTVRLFYW